MVRRIIVNTVLGALIVLLAVYCYNAGKAYTFLLENLPYELNGEQQPAFEALQVSLDQDREPVFMLEDDRINVTGVGKTHVLRIELLDEEDKVVETKEIPFSTMDLDESLTINVARAFAQGHI